MCLHETDNAFMIFDNGANQNWAVNFNENPSIGEKKAFFYKANKIR